MSYIIKYHKSADKEISKLPPSTQLKIIEAIEPLMDNPQPNGYKKLTDYRSERVPSKMCYRIKILKDYRIIYTIEEEIITITIVKVRHRRDIYKK